MGFHKSIKTAICLLLISLSGVVASAAHYSHEGPQNDFVVAHNAIRASVGVGPVAWNESLAKYARDYAGRRASTGCNMVHSGGPYGENLAEGYEEMGEADAVKFWASERKDYDRRSNTCAKGAVCGHFTQVVWRNSVRIGCARQKCPNHWMFVICSYDPPGNYIGDRPY